MRERENREKYVHLFSTVETECDIQIKPNRNMVHTIAENYYANNIASGEIIELIK